MTSSKAWETKCELHQYHRHEPNTKLSRVTAQEACLETSTPVIPYLSKSPFLNNQGSSIGQGDESQLGRYWCISWVDIGSWYSIASTAIVDVLEGPELQP